MMINKNIIKAKYKRARLTPHNTFLWDEMDLSLKSNVLGKIENVCIRDPIICYIESDNYCWVLTVSDLVIITKRLIIIPFTRIEKVELKDLFDEKVSKFENNTLTISVIDDETITLEVEKLTWHLIYNIIRFLVNSSKQ